MDAELTQTIWLAVARAVHFGSCLVLLGVWAFDRIVLTSAGQHRALVARPWMRITRWLVLLALPAVLISGAVWLALVTMQMSGLPFSEAIQGPVLRMVLFHTRFGNDWQWRGVFWIGSAIVAIWILLLREPSELRSVLVWAAAVLGALLLGSLAWAGHGQTGDRPQWHLLADVSHLVISALWPGGLLPLILVLLCLRGAAGEGLPAQSAIVNRFSTLSLSCVAILLGSGIVNSWYMLQSVRDFVGSTYGRVLLLKIILFGAMVLLASLNRFYLKPRLSGIGAGDGQSRAAAQLRVSIGTELVLGIVVVLIVAWLGMLPPPGG